jgi:hypothetical protein
MSLQVWIHYINALVRLWTVFKKRFSPDDLGRSVQVRNVSECRLCKDSSKFIR